MGKSNIAYIGLGMPPSFADHFICGAEMDVAGGMKEMRHAYNVAIA